jgi:hypothetical protein
MPLADGNHQHVTFVLDHIGTPEMDLVPIGEIEEDVPLVFGVEPADSVVNNINGDTIYAEIVKPPGKARRLRVVGNSIDIVQVEINLYENSKLTKGYLKVEDFGDSEDHPDGYAGGDQYSTIGCTVKAVQPPTE